MIISFTTGTKKDSGHRWHGFTQPQKAVENAKRDFQIGEIEEDMIRCHMFPMTWKTPAYTESWVLCTADKICSVSFLILIRLLKSVGKSIPLFGWQGLWRKRREDF